ncbi:MAG: Gfo/Idh/MocA family oxidoreductase [Candidatus Hydrogenedentota bacterium]
MSLTPDSTPTRREFIRTSSATIGTAAAFTIGASAHAKSNKKLKVGLVGCGGRGGGAIVQAISADPDTEVYALGDAFDDQVESTLKKLKSSKLGDRVNVDEDHKFVGFDAYKGVVKSCDVVVLATPPNFRPEHLAYCVEKGKHTFVEKPIAVDPVGIRSVMETCKVAAKKNINVVSGLCYRYQFAKQDLVKRIHDGEIGDIVNMQTTYNTGALWHKGRPESWTEIEYQMRNWLYFDWLSGDHINEQHIHSLDKLGWVMGNEYPVKVTASGGRIARIDPKYGNIYDHFNSVYEWENGVKGFSSCRQLDQTSTDVSDHIFGTKGTAHMQRHQIDFRNGKKWAHEQSGPDDMYQNEHDEFFKAIRSGDTINNGEYMCNSTLMAVMARMSAYTGKTVTREQALDSKLDLSPAKYEWGDHAVNPIARPGVTEFI